MLQIKKHKLDYDEGIKNRLDFICKYVNVKPKFIQGNLINIKRTNLNYVEPHRMIVNNHVFLFFNFGKEVYHFNLNNPIELKDLENFLKVELK